MPSPELRELHYPLASVRAPSNIYDTIIKPHRTVSNKAAAQPIPSITLYPEQPTRIPTLNVPIAILVQPNCRPSLAIP